jgi:hypothetical protein
MRIPVAAALSYLLIGGSAALAQPADIPISTWDAPRYYRVAGGRETEHSSAAALRASTTTSSSRLEETQTRSGTPEQILVPTQAPEVFVSVFPCRVIDTRGYTPPSPPYGAPALSAGVLREFAVIGGGCGIPVGAAAVSANATVTGTTGPGYLSLWPGGGAPWPGVSTLNFTGAGQTVANAAVIPLSATGTISAQTYGATLDFILDVNGYYTSDPNFGPYIKYTLSADTLLPLGASRINWPTPLWVSSDAVGLVTTGANWSFRAPKAGIYEVMAQMLIKPNGTAWATNSDVQFYAMVNGNYASAFGGRNPMAGSTAYVHVDGVTNVVVNANDMIYVSFWNATVGALTADGTNSLTTWMSIRFVGSFQSTD